MSIYRGRNKNEIYLASILYDAIEDLDFRSVKALLETKSADPNLILPKRTIAPFHLIIGNENAEFALDVVRLILQNGGNPNIQSDDGLTPVHIAAAWGRLEILKLLLACGGDPEIFDRNKYTPLHYAFEENYVACYELLKLYLIDKSNILHKENEDCPKFTLTLDKIIVNNGTTVGEYEIVNEYKTEKGGEISKLESLPTTNNSDYVNSWFNSQNHGTELGFSDDSLKESDEERHSHLTKNCMFRKIYRKTVKSSKKAVEAKTNYTRQVSTESGIMTISSSPTEGTSSDYLSCNSPDLLEQNVFDFSGECDNKSQMSAGTKSEGISSLDLTFITVSELYKYEDDDIVLYERRLIKTPPISDESVKSFKGRSIPEVLDYEKDYENYDHDTIRNELLVLGYNAGPVTTTTKRIYLKKLSQLKKTMTDVANDTEKLEKAYSQELTRTLKEPGFFNEIPSYKYLDNTVLWQFGTTSSALKWREGTNKNCFTYLLLDPRITNNLPARSDVLRKKEIWEIFLNGIFYIGKGTRSRPYSHLYDAAKLWYGVQTSKSEKLDKILDIWRNGHGVVSLHLFQNTIPVEAYTREAAMIEAVKVDNLCNMKCGNFYGIAATWTPEEKNKYGIYLLYRAMMIFLNEGERQLSPSDIN